MCSRPQGTWDGQSSTTLPHLAVVPMRPSREVPEPPRPPTPMQSPHLPVAGAIGSRVSSLRTTPHVPRATPHPHHTHPVWSEVWRWAAADQHCRPCPLLIPHPSSLPASPGQRPSLATSCRPELGTAHMRSLPGTSHAAESTCPQSARRPTTGLRRGPTLQQSACCH